MPLLRYLIYTLGIALVTGYFVGSEIVEPGSLKLMVFDSPGDVLGTSEYSPLETVQPVMLAFCALLFSLVAYRYPSQRPVAFLFGGIAAACVIREFDYFLDIYVADNFWQMPVGILLALLIVYTLRQRKRLRLAWLRMWPSPGLTLIYAGALVEFIFAQAIGHEPLWQAIAGEGYQRVVKVTLEEFIELMGYFLWLIGTIEYFYQVRAEAPVWRPDASTGENRRRSRERARKNARKRY